MGINEGDGGLGTAVVNLKGFRVGPNGRQKRLVWHSLPGGVLVGVASGGNAVMQVVFRLLAVQRLASGKRGGQCGRPLVVLIVLFRPMVMGNDVDHAHQKCIHRPQKKPQ